MQATFERRTGFARLRQRKSEKRRRQVRGHSCNICGRSFLVRSRFQLYCRRCRSGAEILKFSDWLPGA